MVVPKTDWFIGHLQDFVFKVIIFIIAIHPIDSYTLYFHHRDFCSFSRFPELPECVSCCSRWLKNILPGWPPNNQILSGVVNVYVFL